MKVDHVAELKEIIAVMQESNCGEDAIAAVSSCSWHEIHRLISVPVRWARKTN